MQKRKCMYYLNPCISKVQVFRLTGSGFEACKGERIAYIVKHSCSLTLSVHFIGHSHLCLN